MFILLGTQQKSSGKHIEKKVIFLILLKLNLYILGYPTPAFPVKAHRFKQFY